MPAMQAHYQLFQQQLAAEATAAEEKRRLHVLLGSPAGKALLATPSGRACVQVSQLSCTSPATLW